jgi:nucleoside-diphosphate-sugar epimerase
MFFRKNESLKVFEETSPYFLHGDFTEEPFHHTPCIIRYIHRATWVMNTRADVDNLVNDVGFKPATPIEDGIKRFVEWYREYYHR